MTLNAPLLVLVVGVLALVFGVDLAALFGWRRRRWHMPAPAPPAAGRWRRAWRWIQATD
jgi:hypothetical protein